MYVQLIQNADKTGWTIERVPEKYRKEVETKIKGGK